MKNVNLIFMCICCLTVGISSCGEDKESTIEVKKIVVEPESARVGVGKTITITATPLPDSIKDAVLEWSSDTPLVATVNQQGVVTGVASGSATITVKSGTALQTVIVDVFQPLTDISLSPTVTTLELTILFGVLESAQFVATSVPANSTELITWESSNINVVTVSDNGLITAIAEGAAVVTVKGSENVIKKEVSVTVKKIGEDPVQFNSKLFKRAILPGDNYEDLNPDNGWAIEGIWNEKQYSAGGSSCASSDMQAFTFDLGTKGLLSYFHLFTWESREEGYPPFSERNLKKFEVWGCETLDESGSWDSWTKLMDCAVIKPSGLPEYEYDESDVQACNNGQKFYNTANYNVPVRYIRVKVVETWGGFPCWRIEEIKLFGTLQ